MRPEHKLVNLQIHQQLLLRPLKGKSRFEVRSILDNIYKEVDPKLVELGVTRQYYEVMKYAFFRGWLRQDSTDKIMTDLDSLVERRLGT